MWMYRVKFCKIPEKNMSISSCVKARPMHAFRPSTKTLKLPVERTCMLLTVFESKHVGIRDKSAILVEKPLRAEYLRISPVLLLKSNCIIIGDHDGVCCKTLLALMYYTKPFTHWHLMVLRSRDMQWSPWFFSETVVNRPCLTILSRLF